MCDRIRFLISMPWGVLVCAMLGKVYLIRHEIPGEESRSLFRCGGASYRHAYGTLCLMCDRILNHNVSIPRAMFSVT
jgi:hypothetical protein